MTDITLTMTLLTVLSTLNLFWPRITHLARKTTSDVKHLANVLIFTTCSFLFLQKKKMIVEIKIREQFMNTSEIFIVQNLKEF